jgi:hypothetical protein
MLGSALSLASALFCALHFIHKDSTPALPCVPHPAMYAPLHPLHPPPLLFNTGQYPCPAIFAPPPPPRLTSPLTTKLPCRKPTMGCSLSSRPTLNSALFLQQDTGRHIVDPVRSRHSHDKAQRGRRTTAETMLHVSLSVSLRCLCAPAHSLLKALLHGAKTHMHQQSHAHTLTHMHAYALHHCSSPHLPENAH